MNRKSLVAIAICLSLGAHALAHRLDEYLQATLISVGNDHIKVLTRLIPGVAVSPAIIAEIDTNGDGIISDAEQRYYAERVLRDLSITVDGASVSPTLDSQKFPSIQEIREGLGEIQIEFSLALPPGPSDRRIVFENHHHNEISAYLVNCLVPLDRNIQIVSQTRNESQSFYQLDYLQGSGNGDTGVSNWPSSISGWMGRVGLASVFRLGMRHIAEGSDHLLFLLALLLPSPLLVVGSRWSGFAGVRQSSLRVLGVVTAFTIGHSLTLAISALGFVRVPNRPIEVLIAVSILISAVHALRPLFPGREAAIAAFFGLIHGLAFATALGELGLGRSERLSALLGFNLGIEAMQLIVVAAVLPSLLLLSSTRLYSVLRISGALFAGLVSVGWIAERLFGLPHSVDPFMKTITHHSVWIAAALSLTSAFCWIGSQILPGISRLPQRRVRVDRQSAGET